FAPRARAMTRQSIRVRLTAWYLAVLVCAILALALGSWWLARRSLVAEVDRTLAAQIAGARDFLEAMNREGLSRNEMKREFAENVELSDGAVWLEVVDANGTVLSRPTLPGWPTLAAESYVPSAAPVDRDNGGEPFRVARAGFRSGVTNYQVVAAISTRAGHD